MIIVSQDKSVIVNFNNVEAIEIGNVEENQCKGTIYARLVSDYFYKIGEYATEKRAKEILQDIIKEYRHYRTAECDGYTNVLEETAVYEMPED